MKSEVKIIEDSINPYNGVRLTTLQLKYWRSIHSEFMTHRVFSRNASSSRAIPIKTMLKQIWNNPAGPIYWGKNQPGMKAREELKGFKKWFAEKIWYFTGKLSCCIVWSVDKISNPHKQTFNRLLEPWQCMHVIVTSTEWDNWFSLRDHPDAQPEIQELARNMKNVINNSVPVEREYHLPYITEEERKNYSIEECFKMSTARCARVSYLTHDGKSPSKEKDINLYNTLVGSIPIHASPTEHPSSALKSRDFLKNFRGWKQHRVDVEDNIINLNKR